MKTNKHIHVEVNTFYEIHKTHFCQYSHICRQHSAGLCNVCEGKKGGGGGGRWKEKEEMMTMK